MEGIDLVQHGWYVGTFLYCLAAGLLPFLSTEAYLLWLAVAAPPADVAPLLITACVAHMVAKGLVFAAGRGVVRLPGARDHARLAALQRRMDAGGRSAAALTFVSALTGFPPFYWFALTAGALRWGFIPFLLAGFAGRVLRFSAVVLLPQGFGIKQALVSVGASNLAVAASTGLLAGLHVATWSLYKDGPGAALAWQRSARALALGAGVALGWELALGLDMALAANRLLLFGLTYVTARSVVELHRACVRSEDAPLHEVDPGAPARGLVERRRRWGLATVWALSLALVAWGVHMLQYRPDRLGPAVLLIVGSLGGWLSAVSGAYRDAPRDGLAFGRFVRRPLLALAWSLLVATLTQQYVLIGLCSLGLTIATVETLRTLDALRPSPRPRRAMPRHVELLHWRRRFAPAFVAVWVVLIVHMAWDWTWAWTLTAGL